MDPSRRQFTRKTLLAGVACVGLTGNLLAGNNRIHTVVRGDTLTKIASKYGVTVTSIRHANKISSDLIRVGQTLTIPETGSHEATSPNSFHIVQRGDTLSGIAVRYGTSVNQIKRDNNLRSDFIRVGQRLAVSTSDPYGSDYLTAPRAATAGINVRRSNWQRIVVHHSAIKHGNAAKYDAAHRRRGMHNGLAYHFVIGNGIDSGDGEIEIGPRWRKQLLGGHVKSYRTNLTAIGICLVGNFEETHPSKRQLDAFIQLMDWLRGEVVPGARKFAGHRELRGEQTICPGKNFPLRAMHARYGS